MLLLSTEVAAHKRQQEAHEAAFANTNADHRESVELLAAQAHAQQAAHESLVKTHEKRLTALRATGLGKVVNRVRQRHKAAAWQASPPPLISLASAPGYANPDANANPKP